MYLQQTPSANGIQIQQATAQLQQGHQGELAAAKRRVQEQEGLLRANNTLLQRAEAAHVQTQV